MFEPKTMLQSHCFHGLAWDNIILAYDHENKIIVRCIQDPHGGMAQQNIQIGNMDDTVELMGYCPLKQESKIINTFTYNHGYVSVNGYCGILYADIKDLRNNISYMVYTPRPFIVIVNPAKNKIISIMSIFHGYRASQPNMVLTSHKIHVCEQDIPDDLTFVGITHDLKYVYSIHGHFVKIKQIYPIHQLKSTHKTKYIDGNTLHPEKTYSVKNNCMVVEIIPNTEE